MEDRWTGTNVLHYAHYCLSCWMWAIARSYERLSMGSKSRSSGMARGEKSGRSLENSSGNRQERARYKKSRGRSSTPKRTASGFSSKVVPSKKAIHRSPLRKSKPLPVNELDILALSQKEQQSKSGHSASCFFIAFSISS